MKPAYYNEFDEYAAQWLRNLIAAGLIAPGEVDSRSITEVTPDDLRGFVQCHFFAGIGVWSHALRARGWPDDRPVWTGSCPCQPFSSAGKQTGTEDERHLWPVWFDLIEKRRPPVVFGEQVEAAIKHGWLDIVQADMERIVYAIAPVGIPAAGVGAPHIRQRLYFVAEELEHAQGERWGQWRPESGRWGTPIGCGVIRLGYDDDAGLEGLGRGYQAESGRNGEIRPVAEAGEFSGLADNECERRSGWEGISTRGFNDGANAGRIESHHGFVSGNEIINGAQPAGPTNGYWQDADWLYCRDGKWRAVEPGTFPLAHGATARVGRLRAYGNAIVSQAAQEVIAAYMACRP